MYWLHVCSDIYLDCIAVLKKELILLLVLRHKTLGLSAKVTAGHDAKMKCNIANCQKVDFVAFETFKLYGMFWNSCLFRRYPIVNEEG